MKFEIGKSRSGEHSVVYARPTNEKGILVVRTKEYGNFVLERLEMALSESMVEAVVDGEDIERQIIEPDLTLSGLRHIVHGHGYVPIGDGKVPGTPRALLPVHDVLELEPATSAQDIAYAAAEAAVAGDR